MMKDAAVWVAEKLAELFLWVWVGIMLAFGAVSFVAGLPTFAALILCEEIARRLRECRELP